jgi:hypothetical protein
MGKLLIAMNPVALEPSNAETAGTGQCGSAEGSRKFPPRSPETDTKQ